jgi:hypothetical protein
MSARIKKVGALKQINDFFKLNASLMKLLQFFFSMSSRTLQAAFGSTSRKFMTSDPTRGSLCSN